MTFQRAVLAGAFALICWSGAVTTSRAIVTRSAVTAVGRPIVVTPIVVPSPEIARTTAVAAWATQLGVDPSLAIAVSRTENPRADDAAWSSTHCCVGVMQVNVAAHYGEYDALCGGSDLLVRAVNICYGVAILRAKLIACNGHLPCALRRYVGASLGNPTGRRYVAAVIARADSVRAEVSQ